MKNAFFGSPLIACVGQRFSQAVQPVQFSATMVKGIDHSVAESRCRNKRRRGVMRWWSRRMREDQASGPSRLDTMMASSSGLPVRPIREGVATPTPGLAPHPTREYVRDRSARLVPPGPALGHDIGQVP